MNPHSIAASMSRNSLQRSSISEIASILPKHIGNEMHLI